MLRGEYCQTLDVTDIATGWTETRAVKNKAQVHVFSALKDIREALPFPLLGIDSDNGSEFINDELHRYCVQEDLTFTRSRAYRKNDGCHVEQKNWSVVRQNVGYARFDTPEETEVLKEIHSLVRLHTNFFMPSAKLVSKTREGSKVTKRSDTPTTPYRRVLARDDVEEQAKTPLTAEFETPDPTTGDITADGQLSRATEAIRVIPTVGSKATRRQTSGIPRGRVTLRKHLLDAPSPAENNVDSVENQV